MESAFADLDAFIDRTADERLADYLDLLRLPSDRYAQSEHNADVTADGRVRRRSASRRWASSTSRSRPPAATRSSTPTGCTPTGAPTVLVYAHYDVQPVDPLELWTRPPFDPVVENGRVWARGAADDKCHVHAHLWAARAWLETRGRLPVNLKIVMEGEEESGSDHFDPWIKANRDRLGADLALISDTGFYEGNKPAITVGLRGLVYTQIDVTGSQVDLHSGSYGGNVQNPANALATHRRAAEERRRFDRRARLLRRGAAADAARPRGVRAHAARRGRVRARLRAALGLAASPSYSVLERRGARPTLDVNGIWGGYQGEGAKTIIPAHAHAKVSCRLVADMDPAEDLRAAARLRDARSRPLAWT